MSVFKRFPSFRQLQQGAIDTLRRFPFTLAAAIVGTIAAVILVEEDRLQWAQRLLLTCALGVPLFTALVSFAEMRTWPKLHTLGLQAAGAALLVLYYFTLQPDPFQPHFTAMRWLLLFIGLHFLVAFLPFRDRDRAAGFWPFNKALFLRFLQSALYSAVLYAGLAIALAAADNLFGADVPFERYAQLWIIIAGIFNTWMFLAGVPESMSELSQSDRYPKGLKVFTQFILLPLVGLYFLILIAYEIKIIIEWEWPRGWVSELILWYAVVGILSLLLLHPLRDKSDSTWIQVFGRWFFRALVPLVVLLFLAIMVRIGDYGFTPPRYFVLAMAVGLSIVVLYFIFSRKKDIRIIPIILCALAFLSAYGPWSAFAVSKSSQLQRLNVYLVGDESSDTSDLATVDVRSGRDYDRNASSIVSYLVDWHGMEPFEALLDDSTIAAIDTLPTWEAKTVIARSLGFEYAQAYGTPFDRGWFRYSTYPYTPATPQPPADITGFDKLVRIYGVPNQGRVYSFVVDDQPLTLACDPYGLLRVRAQDDTLDVLATFSLKRLVDQHWPNVTDKQFGPHELQLGADRDSLAARLLVSEIAGYYIGDSLNITNLYGVLLLNTEQPETR